MNKLIALLLSVCVLFTIAGCKKTPDKTPNHQVPHAETSTSSTEDSTQTGGIPVGQKPMVSVSLPIVTESTSADNGTVIFNYTTQVPYLIVPDPDVAEDVINDFLTRIDPINTDAESILEAARSAYTGSSLWTPYVCSITYAPQRVDYGILSLFGNDVRFSGGAHSVVTGVSINYDLITGKALSLTDILTDSTSADTVCQLVINALADLSTEVTLNSDYETTVTDSFSGKLADNGSWYLSQTGLCFYFSPYEIAPYSAGVVVVEIPYEKLTGIMEDAYFPAERDAVSGTVSAESFDAADLDAYTQFSEIVLESGKEKILLYTDKSVYDVRIESGTWSASGKLYTPMYTVFAAHTLTPGDAVMVESALTEAAPALRLSYKTGSETVTTFISKASDGSVQLTAG